MRHHTFLTAGLSVAISLLAGCSGGGSDTPLATPPVTGPSCSVAQLEGAMESTLASVERQDGRRYSYNRGGSTLQTSYESASTSKLVSAVVILRLVPETD